MIEPREQESWRMSWMRLQGQLMHRRHKLGLSQDDLAGRLGVNRKTIVRWENGGRQLHAMSLFRWADALGVSITSELRDRSVPSVPPAMPAE